MTAVEWATRNELLAHLVAAEHAALRLPVAGGDVLGTVVGPIVRAIEAAEAIPLVAPVDAAYVNFHRAALGLPAIKETT